MKIKNKKIPVVQFSVSRTTTKSMKLKKLITKSMTPKNKKIPEFFIGASDGEATEKCRNVFYFLARILTYWSEATEK